MSQNLIEEVNRIKKIMGIIKESSVLSWIDELFKVATNSKIILNSFKTLEDRILPNNLDLIKQSIDEGINEGVKDSVILKNAIAKVAEKSNVSYDEALKSILKNQEGFDKILLDELVNIKIKNIIDDVEFSKSIDDIVKQKVDAKIKPVLDSQVKQSIDFLKKLDPDTLKTELEERIKKLNDLGLSDSVKNFWKNTYDILAKEKNIKLFESDDITKIAQDKMKERLSLFRTEFKKTFDLAVSKFGVSWEEILGPEGIRNTEEGLEILEKFFGDRKWYFGDGTKQLTVTQIREQLSGYKGFKGSNGEWSSVNFLDTNSLDSSQFFINQAKKILSNDEYTTLIARFADDTITKDDEILRKVLDTIENDKNLWDDMVLNPSNYLTNISKTTAAGSEGEEIAVKWFTTMGDVKILWRATTGSPLDRLLGIDFILDVGGEASTVNVKRITGSINKKINTNDVLGDSYKIWSKYGVNFGKQTNLTYGILVDSGGNFIMFKKQPGVNWQLQTRTNYQRFPSCQANRCTYVDKVEGVRVYFNE